jgi:hypothetical protein
LQNSKKSKNCCKILKQKFTPAPIFGEDRKRSGTGSTGTTGRGRRGKDRGRLVWEWEGKGEDGMGMIWLVKFLNMPLLCYPWTDLPDFDLPAQHTEFTVD